MFFESIRNKHKKYIVSVISLVAAGVSAPVHAQQTDEIVDFDIPAQKLSNALKSYGVAADRQVLFAVNLVRGKQANAVSGELQPNVALDRLLMGSGLAYETTASDVVVIKTVQQDASAGQTLRTASVEEDDAVSITISEGEGHVLPELEEIIVTGTNIRGVGASASPVLRFDREEIGRSGNTTVADFMQRAIPQNFAGGASQDTSFVDRGNSIINEGLGTGVNLRGLGADSTLVLLNGRRMASSGFGTFVDISQIPLSAIDRIDVLTDGASAIYGSDAIGGVVNFILRDDYDGAETRLRSGIVTDGRLSEFQAAQALGKSWDTGNVLLSYEFFTRKPLDANDRALTEGSPDPFDVLPGQDRHSIFFTARQELSSNVEVFGTALYSDRTAERRSFSPFTGNVLLGEPESTDISASLGTNIALSESWSAELAGTYSRNKTVGAGIVITENRPFNANETIFTSWVVDAKADGDIFELPGGNAKLAIGGQYRGEEFDSRIFGQVPTLLDRDVFAAFGEVYIPIVGEANSRDGVQRLELTAAVRFEDYSDFGSTTDPKLGLLWTPVDGINLRGTWGISFRAPLFRELDELSFNAIGPIDVLDPSAPGGTIPIILVAGNNGDLGPETAETWTVGVDFAPEQLSVLNFSLTYFDIAYEDRIAEPDFLPFFISPIDDPLVAPFVSLTIDQALIDQRLALAAVTPGALFDFTAGQVGVAGAQGFADVRLQNLARTDINGVDFSAAYTTEAGSGELGVTFAGTYLFSFDNQALATTPVEDVLGRVFNPPELRFRTGASWSNDAFGANIFVNHVDDLVDIRTDPATSIDSWITVDLQVNLNLGEVLESDLLNDSQIDVSVQNLFDDQPPFVQDAALVGTNFNFDPENHDILGRFISIGITKSF